MVNGGLTTWGRECRCGTRGPRRRPRGGRASGRRWRGCCRTRPGRRRAAARSRRPSAGARRTWAALEAPRAGRLVSFDLNWRPMLWRDRDPAVLRELVNAADIALLGADEAEVAFGTGDPDELRRLFPGPGTLVVKDAERVVTALSADGGAGPVAESALAVEVVEPTGAGDAFAAGYLAGTLRGFDQRRRLRLRHLAPASAP